MSAIGGMSKRWKMSEIVFVRHYKTKGVLHEDVYEVRYKTGRGYTYYYLPKSVEKFMSEATARERDYPLYGKHTIYKR